ncbi:MAG: hypothetical protein QXP91_09680 [Candidatus Methanomethylicia archaeon]
MNYSIPSCIQQYSVGSRFWRSMRMVRCPLCGFEFSLLYSRTISCQGCPESILGCEYVRCPKCEHEFKITSIGITSSKKEAKSISRYLSRILSEYCRDFGESPSK